MFNPGAHIEIVASSKRKGTGPRRGSLGFVKWASDNVQFEDGYALLTVEVIFYRFGFEERLRSEIKHVVIMLPTKHITDGDVGFEMKKLTRQISNKKYEAWQVKMKKVAETNGILAIARPKFGLNLLECPAEVYATWARSILSSPRFNFYVGKASISGHITRLSGEFFDNATLGGFQRATADLGYREEAINATAKTALGRRLFIEKVRFVDSAVGLPQIDVSMSDLKSVFGGAGYPPTADPFMNAMYFFAPLMFKTPHFERGLAAAKHGLSTKPLKHQSINAIDQMESVREWVLGLF
jgi:hypothetical protein